MKSSKLPPFVILNSSKEVIFYVSKNSKVDKDIKLWLKKLCLTNYNGMIINSKCIFNRFTNQNCQ